ncbi:hypothetical protein CRENBAI_013501 [Crenichthys baileyi]|uniref:Uncharacterized protein n=1 Tax=Crenichthys baileyi TaxID=28760 RepID=A0AAV9SCY0_9TELE
MPEPPQLAPLDVEKQRLYSESLPGDRASHPISKGEPRHPAEKTLFGHLYPKGFLPQQPHEPHAASLTTGVRQRVRGLPPRQGPTLRLHAPVSRLGNGGAKHGPFGLNVPHRPQNVFEALPEVGVEAPPHGRLRQVFPANPQDSFGFARSDRHPPSPSEPAHHQVVVSGKLHSPLHPSVQDIRPQIR